MNIASLKGWKIPEGIAVKVMRGTSLLWEKDAEIINWARCSINADGTIYNNGQGYKRNYRIRSGGAESSGTDFLCTGFIPFEKGKTLEISPPFRGMNTENTVNFADGSFNNLGQATDSGARYGICTTTAYLCTTVDGVSRLTFTDELDSSIAYVRVTHYMPDTSDGENLVITVT